ncbi:GPP34 family phosphoprotein [Nocardiopsis gilva YIM 90087]|uniref:GPP34 family phosphoprotein n=1 Tax=Nocardiopsis gilva YIM 90087 TaxID=1235441 RepID=A0A223S2K3_9ACTN|nr:GPP34 family phosphoprotein [Nocardiopsis gilva]ASU82355.1 GPP34 family phosphoprotein [Nocardiopsis gilva YIM 90087]
MTASNGTILAEELLLICHDPATGRPLADSTRVQVALAGALLADLALADRIRIDGRGYVYAQHPAPSGDPDLDALAQRIAMEQRHRKLKWWVQKTMSNKLRTGLLYRVAYRGLMRHEQDHVLGMFPWNRYRPADPAAHAWRRESMRAVLVGERAPDPATVVLLALAGAMRVDGKLFPELRGNERRRLMKTVVANDGIGQVVRNVIQSIEASTAVVIGAAATGGAAGGS